MRHAHRSAVIRVVLAMSAGLPLAARASTVAPVFAIPGFNDGALPTGLTEFGGRYYGTAYYGGPGTVQASYTTGKGVIYRIDPRGGAYAIVHYFGGSGDGSNPGSGLTVFQGKLYGTTTSGGVNGNGVVFSLDPSTETETVIGSLPAGVYGGSKLTIYHDRFYASSNDTIFSVDPASGMAQIEYQFPDTGSAGFTAGDLLVYGNYLYGTASEGGKSDGGTLFRFDPRSDDLRVEHSFGAHKDGSEPNGDLIEIYGSLYGTTFGGGGDRSTLGTIFSFNPETREESVLYSFSRPGGIGPSSGLLSYNNHLLYGRTEDGSTYNNGTLFAFDLASATLTVVHVFTGMEGYDEGPPLTQVDGMLWGLQDFGGVAGEGSLFSVDPASGSLTILHNFAGAQESGASGLTRIKAALYGTAAGGGANGLGSIYKVEPRSGLGRTLYSFKGDADGARPMAPLLDIGGTLYGTTNMGGVPSSSTMYSAGTVFSFEPDGRVMRTLAAFDDGKLGGSPSGPLATLNGALFGTTNQGGASYSGTVFKLDLATAQLTTLASFPYVSYGAGSTGLVAAGGLLYGTTTQGGASNEGMIFSVDPSSGQLTTLLSFAGDADGGQPMAPLFYSNGLLYGSTPGSGRQPATVFSFNPATNTKTILRDLHAGPQIEAALIERDGKLYATFPNGAKSNEPDGGIIRLNPQDGNAMITAFSPGPVTRPASPLTQSDDALFGTTITSTTDNAGTVFRYMP